MLKKAQAAGWGDSGGIVRAIGPGFAAWLHWDYAWQLGVRGGKLGNEAFSQINGLYKRSMTTARSQVQALGLKALGFKFKCSVPSALFKAWDSKVGGSKALGSKAWSVGLDERG